MDLWIRSQNKYVLCKASCLTVGFDAFLEWAIFNNNENLGSYETEKRALEVLDSIQSCLNARNIISPRKTTDYQRIKEQFFDSNFIITDGSIDIIPSDVIIYEMPKE